jgi:hypothetical protein
MQPQHTNLPINRQCDIFIRNSATFKVVSEANLGEFWAKKRARVTMQHKVVFWELRCLKPILIVKLPCKVIMTRFGAKEMDSDNLISAFKHIRDAIANYIRPGLAPGKADDDKRITWECKQVIVKDRKQQGIRIEIL